MTGRKGLSGGRNKRPDASKRREGRRTAADAPHAPRSHRAKARSAKAPQPPDHLSDQEKATWRAVIASLPKEGRYDPVLLEAYTVALSAQRTMIRDGLASPQRLRAFVSLTNLIRQCASEIQLAAERAPATARPKTLAELQGEQMEMILATGDHEDWMLAPDGEAYGNKRKRSKANGNGSKPNGHVVEPG